MDKNEYMVVMHLPENFVESFAALIPEQREQVNLLLQKGIVTSYSLSLDRTHLWAILRGKNEREIIQILARLPIFKHVRYELHELAFHNSPVHSFPQVSLN